MRVRKFSPFDRQNPVFEVCNEAGDPIFDVSQSDADSSKSPFMQPSPTKSFC